jgi:hypothetical protein
MSEERQPVIGRYLRPGKLELGNEVTTEGAYLCPLEIRMGAGDLDTDIEYAPAFPTPHEMGKAQAKIMAEYSGIHKPSIRDIFKPVSIERERRSVHFVPLTDDEKKEFYRGLEEKL